MTNGRLQPAVCWPMTEEGCHHHNTGSRGCVPVVTLCGKNSKVNKGRASLTSCWSIPNRILLCLGVPSLLLLQIFLKNLNFCFQVTINPPIRLSLPHCKFASVEFDYNCVEHLDLHSLQSHLCVRSSGHLLLFRKSQCCFLGIIDSFPEQLFFPPGSIFKSI